MSGRHFADKLHLHLEPAVNDQAAVSAAYGVAFPRQAARELLGDERFQIAEVAVYVSF